MRSYLQRAVDTLRVLARLDDPPWRIALSLAVGVFISCTPFWGIQTVLSIVTATIFRLNKAAAVAGAWLNLPWFAPLLYVVALKVGAVLLPDGEGLHGVSLALLVGTTLVGLVAASATYVVALGLITWRRARRAEGRSAGGGAARTV